jgi:importin subunit alpha-1
MFLLILERNPPIAEVIACGVIPKFVEFLAREENPSLQVIRYKIYLFLV